ncbi:MAG: hypothetical protein ACI4LM_05420, partial [Anaerovoracaceae bacterium]
MRKNKTNLSGLVNSRRDRLTHDSVREAVNAIPAGICFVDENERVMLCNVTMGEIISELIGSYPQTADDLRHAFEIVLKGEKGRCISRDMGVYQLPDGRVWRIYIDGTPDGRLLTAHDVTKFHEMNEDLRKETQELEVVNSRIRAMYDTLADRVREKETLELRVRIHDNMGQSLIVISDLLAHGDERQADEQIAALKDAVSFLSDDRPQSASSLKNLRREASAMGVTLDISGSTDFGHDVESMLVHAARECVTNCVRHAHGDRVDVEVSREDDLWRMTFTNNGTAPGSEIKEGGGLTNLRKSVEEAGGTMS